MRGKLPRLAFDVKMIKFELIGGKRKIKMEEPHCGRFYLLVFLSDKQAGLRQKLPPKAVFTVFYYSIIF